MSLPAFAGRSLPLWLWQTVSLPLAALCGSEATGDSLAVGRAAVRMAEDRVVRTLALRPGQTLAIAITNGTIRVVGEAGRSEIRLAIVRRAPTDAALATAPLVLSDTADGARLAITQASGGADPSVRAEVIVTAPVDVRLDPIGIAEGGLDLRHVHGAVRATVARGDIHADDVAGVVRLETTLGSITVTGAALTRDGLIRLRTFNGDVRLALASALADTRVMALALNGTISSTVPLVMKDGWGPRWGETTIGRGDRVLSVDVVSGAIRIEAPAGR